LEADPELETELLAALYEDGSTEVTCELLETRTELDDGVTETDVEPVFCDVVIDDRTDEVILVDEIRVDFEDEDDTTVEDLVCDVDAIDDVAGTDELFCSDEALEGNVVDEVIGVDLTELELLRTFEELMRVDEIRVEDFTVELVGTTVLDQVM
jgi:hypothetical protein